MCIRRTFGTALFCLLLTSVTVANAAPKAAQVLFVGNSLTYVGNLPAVFTALAADSGHPVHTDMLVKGGATLTQWLDSGAVQRALKAGHYDYVILQERGNDFACGFGPQVCRDSRRALRTLAHGVREDGAKPVLLGTYEPDPAGSTALVAAESKAARANAMPYVAVSNRMNAGRKKFPHANWFWKDGMHPGHELVLLDAVLLYRQLFGALPGTHSLAVAEPMFVPSSKFSPPDPTSAAITTADISFGHVYTRAQVVRAIALAWDK